MIQRSRHCLRFLISLVSNWIQKGLKTWNFRDLADSVIEFKLFFFLLLNYLNHCWIWCIFFFLNIISFLLSTTSNELYCLMYLSMPIGILRVLLPVYWSARMSMQSATRFFFFGEIVKKKNFQKKKWTKQISLKCKPISFFSVCLFFFGKWSLHTIGSLLICSFIGPILPVGIFFFFIEKFTFGSIFFWGFFFSITILHSNCEETTNSGGCCFFLWLRTDCSVCNVCELNIECRRGFRRVTLMWGVFFFFFGSFFVLFIIYKLLPSSKIV